MKVCTSFECEHPCGHKDQHQCHYLHFVLILKLDTWAAGLKKTDFLPVQTDL